MLQKYQFTKASWNRTAHPTAIMQLLNCVITDIILYVYTINRVVQKSDTHAITSVNVHTDFIHFFSLL